MGTNSLQLSAEVAAAISAGEPVLALESTIIAHGMPYPENLEFANEAEALARDSGVIPATIAIIDGLPCIGLNQKQLASLAQGDHVEKVATREIGWVCSQGKTGATTVSATMHLAKLAGVQVFATGGIGGVHRGVEESWDISADLLELARTSVIVVSAGAKAILDLHKTIEYLETMSVAVLGYGTKEFPSFYSRHSGIELNLSAQSAEEIASAYKSQISHDIHSGMLIANPVPEDLEIPFEQMESIIRYAINSAEREGIRGKELTPYLLERIVQLTEGQSLITNRALALNNVKLGAEIAKALSERA